MVSLGVHIKTADQVPEWMTGGTFIERTTTTKMLCCHQKWMDIL